MNLFDSLVVIVAKYFIIIPILIFIFVFIKNRMQWKKIIVYALLCVIFTLIISSIAAKIYYDPRPFVSDNVTSLFPYTADNGFPSDHTMLAAATTAIILPYSLGWGIISGIITILIGWSRVYAVLHHVIDIIGGIIIPLISALLAFYLSKFIFKKTRMN